jgi:hypothetical protein
MSKQQTRGYKGQLFILDLSYLGWGILASLPVGFYSGVSTWQTLQSGVTDYYPSVGTIAASTLSAGSFSASPLISNLLLSDWAWTLLIGLWSLVVSLFYLPNYQCVELGYFEVAKSTSGVGFGASPRQDNQGPDNMGGF